MKDINVIPFKRVLKNDDQHRKTGLFPIDIKLKNIPEKKNPPGEQLEFPFDEWTTPSEPNGYIKGRDNDFL